MHPNPHSAYFSTNAVSYAPGYGYAAGTNVAPTIATNVPAATHYAPGATAYTYPAATYPTVTQVVHPQTNVVRAPTYYVT